MSWFERLWSPRSGMTDEQAMGRVQQQADPEAFAELVRRWEQPLRRLGTRMIGDAHRGEDLAQEAFVRVFANRSDFDPGRRFATWLWRIAMNLCRDELRRVQRRGEFPLAGGVEDDADDGPVLQAVDPAPDEQVIGQERAAIVRAALLGLPESLRAVVVLREYEGLKLREIADVLEVPEGTVKSRLAEALARLARRLEPMRKEFEAGPVAESGRTPERIAL